MTTYTVQCTVYSVPVHPYPSLSGVNCYLTQILINYWSNWTLDSNTRSRICKAVQCAFTGVLHHLHGPRAQILEICQASGLQHIPVRRQRADPLYKRPPGSGSAWRKRIQEPQEAQLKPYLTVSVESIGIAEVRLFYKTNELSYLFSPPRIAISCSDLDPSLQCTRIRIMMYKKQTV